MYLGDNPVCAFRERRFRPRRRGSRRPDVASVSLFRMLNRGYKPFDKYVRGLRLLDDWAGGKGMEVRLHVERDLLDDPDVGPALGELANTRVYAYDCPAHAARRGKHSLFGTLVRFFPMFDFEGNDARFVVVCDADVKPENIPAMDERYDRAVARHAGARSVPMVAYDGTWNRTADPGDEIPYCIADSMVSLRRADKRILVDFLEEMRRMRAAGKARRWNEYRAHEAGRRSKKCEAGLCFGIDEWFVNRVFLPELLRRRAAVEYTYNYWGIAPLFDAYRPGEREARLRGVVKEYLRRMYPPGGMDYGEVDRKMYGDVVASRKTTRFVEDFMRRLFRLARALEAEGDRRLPCMLKKLELGGDASRRNYYFAARVALPGGTLEIFDAIPYSRPLDAAAGKSVSGTAKSVAG